MRRFAEDKQLIEDELLRVLAGEKLSNGPLVFDCMDYTVFSGGKRIRPLLGLQVARAFTEAPTACLSCICAVELLHTASLIVDDLPSMDNAPMRRSRAAAHVIHGEGIAILASFALVVLGIRIAQAASRDACLPGAQIFADMLLDAIGRRGMICGQESDLTGKRAMANCYSKTTPLFALACAAGLVGCGVREEVRFEAIEFGRCYGRAYQAVDDMMDDGYPPQEAQIEVGNCFDHLQRLHSRDRRGDDLRTFVDWLTPHISTSHDKQAR